MTTVRNCGERERIFVINVCPFSLNDFSANTFVMNFFPIFHASSFITLIWMCIKDKFIRNNCVKLKIQPNHKFLIDGVASNRHQRILKSVWLMILKPIIRIIELISRYSNNKIKGTKTTKYNVPRCYGKISLPYTQR